MNSATLLNPDHEQSKQRVDRFVHRFMPSYRLLAYYAALPLVLTPELLNYLRNQFLRGSVLDGEELPWVSEVDLLLSDLCQQVGYEQYGMDTAVRAYLLAEMEQELGSEQIQTAARLLIRYVEQLAHTHPYIPERERKSQQWAAMVYLDDQRETAAREIAEAFRDAIAPVGWLGADRLIDRSEMLRLSRLTHELAQELAKHPELASGLIRYAQLVRDVLIAPNAISPEQINQLYQPQQVLDVELPSLAEVISGLSELIPPVPDGPHPVLRTLEFETATLVPNPPEPLDIAALEPFEFEIVTIAPQTQDAIQPAPESNIEKILTLLNQELAAQGQRPLNDLQWVVLHGSLQGKSYKDIHRDAGQFVELDHLMRNVGPKLWKLLSDITGEKVTKAHLQGPLVQWLAQSRPTELTLTRQSQQAWQFVQDLGNSVTLEMVQIPPGTFLMGSPKNEPERHNDESPQHQVTVQPFFFSKYPVTQAQWRAVTALPQIDRQLDPDPSNFKGNNRPVEQISWFDAVEFCRRLSAHTGRTYRLPSEAEWEYACRAGTTTPFHVGKTITTDLANYNGDYTYGQGPKGVYRNETTNVGSFPANPFGLHDMHGNVWEWCLDHWHENYEGAPTDGSAWLNSSNLLTETDDRLLTEAGDPIALADDNEMRVYRGGSWYNNPRDCRSASRNRDFPDFRNHDIGFRVVCVLPRTL